MISKDEAIYYKELLKNAYNATKKNYNFIPVKDISDYNLRNKLYVMHHRYKKSPFLKKENNELFFDEELYEKMITAKSILRDVILELYKHNKKEILKILREFYTYNGAYQYIFLIKKGKKINLYDKKETKLFEKIINLLDKFI